MGAFHGSGMVEIQIPDDVEQLGELCFYNCKNLSRVTFGESSSLRRIGEAAFHGSGMVEIHAPNSRSPPSAHCMVMVNDDTPRSTTARLLFLVKCCFIFVANVAHRVNVLTRVLS